MSTKTISVDLEAYNRLARARRSPRESFSQVIKRGLWPGEATSAGAWLRDWGAMPVAEEDVLTALDRAQNEDRPPEDSWSDS